MSGSEPAAEDRGQRGLLRGAWIGGLSGAPAGILLALLLFDALTRQPAILGQTTTIQGVPVFTPREDRALMFIAALLVGAVGGALFGAIGGGLYGVLRPRLPLQSNLLSGLVMGLALWPLLYIILNTGLKPVPVLGPTLAAAVLWGSLLGLFDHWGVTFPAALAALLPARLARPNVERIQEPRSPSPPPAARLTPAPTPPPSRGVTARAPPSPAPSDLSSQMAELLARDGRVDLDDVRNLLSEARSSRSEAPIARARQLLQEKTQMVDERQGLLAELADIERKVNSLTDLFASGKISEEGYKSAREDIEIRKRDIQERVHRIDSELYKEEYEKPVF